MVPVLTLDRKDIDLLLKDLNKSILHFNQALVDKKPHIHQAMVDEHKRARNRLSKALAKHKYKMEKIANISKDQ